MQAHASLLYFATDSYRRICKPLKLFEAITLGLPVISKGDSSASRFIEGNNLGWIAGSEPNSLGKLIKRLLHDRNDLKRVSQNVFNHRHEHSWESRAKKVVQVLGHG